MCAGVTSYKGIKETDTKPGDFLVVVGAAGGLGHLAVQYGKAMGLRVIAVDVGQDKIDYCKSLGAEFGVDIASSNGGKTAAQVVEEYTGGKKYVLICPIFYALYLNGLMCSPGGAHGVLVLATQPSAFKAAVDMSRRKGTVVCVGLPSGSFDCPIIDVVLKRVTIRGSIVGTRQVSIKKFPTFLSCD